MDALPHQLHWHRSRYCSANSCVEVAAGSGRVWVRDAGDPDGRLLQFPAAAWNAFVDEIRRGSFDLP